MIALRIAGTVAHVQPTEEVSAMPKVSKQSAANVQEFGSGTEWSQVLEGQRASFVSTTADADLTPLLKGLPNDECPCPHWGYVFKGRMWFRCGGREEVYEAGDAFYVPPGHTSGASGGSEFLVFSPDDLMTQVDANMMRRAQELQGASPL
jgi:hypothetical protein